MKNLNKQFINLRLMFLRNGKKRGDYLRKKKIFQTFGCNVWWQPYKIPTQPLLVAIGNNVCIATEVLFMEHDIISGMLNIKYKTNKYKDYFGTIEIGDNTFVGARSIILYNTKIGKNCIIGAGSIVTKDIPDNSIAVGNPARVIGQVEKIEKERALYSEQVKDLNLYNESILNKTFWKNKRI